MNDHRRRGLFHLRPLSGDSGRPHLLAEGEYLVGSSRTADVFLPTKGVSRRHAWLVVSSRGIEVEDLASTNGTRLDGERLTNRKRARPGTELRFGPVCFRLEAAPAEESDLAIDLGPWEAPRPATVISPAELEEPTQMVDEAEPPEPASTGTPQLAFPAAYCRGTSEAMSALYERMRRLSRGDLPVLISGETGVGKEMIARILHDSSERSSGPWVAINCAAIPNDLLEAELFGIAKGVATGVEARSGKFQLAEGGTLFLDEIGEMAAQLQAKLLRALQEKEIHPLGGRRIPIDVRVISATNAELARRLEDGTLRADLYYRLAGVVLEVPALRERREDIPGLVEYFLRDFSTRAGVRPRGLTRAALRDLVGYAWPGNVRELEHEIRRLAFMASDGEIFTCERLAGHIRQPGIRPGAITRLVAGLDSLEMAPLIAALEEALIREALRQTGGVKIEACRLLGLSRNGLDKKLRRLKIGVEEFSGTAQGTTADDEEDAGEDGGEHEERARKPSRGD